MKDILLHLNYSDSVDGRLTAAAALAARFNSHINGLFIRRNLPHENYGSFLHADEFNEFEIEQIKQVTEAKRQFAIFGKTIGQSVEFIEVSGDYSQRIVRQSAANDLVVIGKFKEQTENHHLAELPATVALGSGRPVLVVPELSADASIGKSVLVAWSGTREAARTIHDAMPILQTTDYVNVVTFAPEGEHESIVDISHHVDHYGLTYDTTHNACADAEIADRLFQFIGSFDSDLWVMGAYGHSRLREYVLGGVSRSVLRNIEIPLLVSH